MAIEVAPLLLCIDKPAGITSFGVVARVRSILGVKKVGHAGTLDPLATGLMLVGVGAGTKLLTALVHQDKEYETDILLGQQRTTGDMEGDVLREVEVRLTDEIVVRTPAAVAALVGTQTLPVSAYSAIKRDGVPMYRRARAAARRGEQVTDVPYREMRVAAAVCEGVSACVLDGRQYVLVRVRFTVGSGTYIRSLAEALGAKLGCPATVYRLRRTRVGAYHLAAAETLEALATRYKSTRV